MDGAQAGIFRTRRFSAAVRRVLTVARPDRIILFGSAATGQMTKDSDIDLLVVEPTLANTHERRVAIRGAVGDIGYPVDVIVMRNGTLRTNEALYRRHCVSS